MSDTTPDVGDKDVITNNFKITAGATEGLTDRSHYCDEGWFRRDIRYQ